MTPADFRSVLLAAASYGEALDAVADWFARNDLYFGHGTDNADDEAYWLVAAVLGWDEKRWSEPTAPDVLERIASLAGRRVAERMPLAYLLGEAWFAGLRFTVDPSVLVPRSPLAELIENGLSPWCRLGAGDRVLEIGTGSGCIAIAVAVHVPGVRVDATDVSAEALDLAAANATALGVADRVHFVEADLFPEGRECYRAIISNPPYVPSARLAELPAEYRHEPALGLDGGPDGLGPVRRILAGARDRLEADGVLIVEVGESAEALERAFPRLPLTWLEFEHGGSGVFVLTRSELEAVSN